jgi:hypothetical protein
VLIVPSARHQVLTPQGVSGNSPPRSDGITHEWVTTPEGSPNRLKPSTVQTILTWEGSMSSSTAAPATGRGGRYAAREGYGLIIFASVLLLVLSFFNLIDGIAAVANSHVPV